MSRSYWVFNDSLMSRPAGLSDAMTRKCGGPSLGPIGTSRRWAPHRIGESISVYRGTVFDCASLSLFHSSGNDVPSFQLFGTLTFARTCSSFTGAPLG